MPAAGGQSSQASSATVLSADFPFDASGKFRAKMPFSYRFSLPSPTTVSVVTALQSGQPGSVSCRLYLLQEDGISDQYFLGYQEGGKCYILAALSAGDYQLQLQPTSADTTFTVVAAQASGDGNDGFTEADSLQNGMLHTENLSGGDFQDWFSFTVAGEAKMTVELSNSAQLACIVYAMSDVDLYGFSGPECNRSYSYPSGSYYVSVGRKLLRGANQTYTIRLLQQ